MPPMFSIRRWLKAKADSQPRRRRTPFPPVHAMEVRILLSATVMDADSSPLADVDWTPTDGVADQEGLEVTKDDAAFIDGNDNDAPIKGVADDALGIPVDGELPEENGLPTEGWDPSWAYRTLTVFVSEGDEQVVEPDFVGWEDGLGCGIAPDGFVSGDLALDDFNGGGQPDIAMEVPRPESPDDFLLYPFDFVIEFGADGLGCGVAPDGFVPGDMTSNDFGGDGEPVDFVMYAFDPLPLDENPEIVDGMGTDADGNADEFDIGPVRYLGGPEYRGGNEGIYVVSDDFVLNPNDPLFIEDGGEIIDGGAESPHVIFYSFNAAAGSDAAPPDVDTAIVSGNVDTLIVSGNNAGPSNLTGREPLFANPAQAIGVALPANTPSGVVVDLIPNPAEVSGESDLDQLVLETSADSSVATSLPEGLADTAVVDVSAHVDCHVDANL